MGPLYLAALILGGGISMLGFVGSGDGSEEAELDGHAEADGSGADDHAAGATAHHTGLHHADAGALSFLLSLRFWTFALLAFGAAGSLLHYLELAGSFVTAVAASGIGLASGGLASWTFRQLGQTELSSGSAEGDAVGQVGRVLVACGKGRRGKVRLELKGQTVDMLASSDSDELAPGELVLIEDVRGEELKVSRAPDELLLKG